ncbi:MAG: helicase-related protein [Candidatus Aenigmatarchaeota archaeon]
MTEKKYVDHPLIEKDSIEKRLYQETILNTSIRENTLVVLPTGMGKTVSALLLAAHRLNKKGGKILFLAPTRPLVEQHKKFFAENLEIAEGDMMVMTGKVRPNKREKEYPKKTCIFATPQVIQNDVIADRINLDDFTLAVFDECHRATGDYPYSFIAEMYMRRASEPRILGLTASPGGNREKIMKVMDNLYLDEVEIRTEEDSDVQVYRKPTKKNWKKIELPEEFKEVKELLEKALNKRTKRIKKMDVGPSSGNLYKKDLLKLQGQLRSEIGKGEDSKETYFAISKIAEALKIEHALMLLETQGSSSLYEYLKKLKREAEEGKTKASKRVMSDFKIKVAYRKTSDLLEKGIEHPKLAALEDVVRDELQAGEGKKIIVFSHYRSQVELIKKRLKEMDGCRPIGFVGQAGEEGLSQKRQVEILDQFEEGKYNALIATSVGEEGLDIPAVDLVVFYEPVASEIRSIQRRGRTGRQEEGKLMVLIAKDTRDEAYYWKSKHRERRMKETLKEIRDSDDGRQRNLDDY